MCWIDVNTQLPEEGSIVDVWCDDERIPNAVYRRFAFWEIPRDDNPDELDGVTHWRYPPAPPESANVAK
jgi:hypothetical protein